MDSLRSPLTPDVRLAHAPAPSSGHIPRACSASANRQLLGSTISVRQHLSLRPVGRVALPVPAPRPRGRSWFLRPRRSPARLIPSVAPALSDRGYSSTLRPPEQPRCRPRSRTPKSALFPAFGPAALAHTSAVPNSCESPQHQQFSRSSNSVPTRIHVRKATASLTPACSGLAPLRCARH